MSEDEVKKNGVIEAVMDPVTGTLPIMWVAEADTDVKLTDEEAAEEEFLLNAFSNVCQRHQEEADRVGAEIYNFGWVSSFSPTGADIFSKTSHGYLDTTWNRETDEVKHRWPED
jgi:hypothetical protein